MGNGKTSCYAYGCRQPAELEITFPFNVKTLRYCRKDGQWEIASNQGQLVREKKGGRWKDLLLRDPADETEPRIMLQILYNLLANITRNVGRKQSWNETVYRRILHARKLAKVYVNKTGGITH